MLLPQLKKDTFSGRDKVANICNPSYLGDGDWEDYNLRRDKKLVRPYLNQQSGHAGMCLSSQLHRRYK
jgi:hypothetical protein